MAKIARLIIYESNSKKDLDEQLKKSLPEGTHKLAVNITIIPLSIELANSIQITNSLIK